MAELETVALEIANRAGARPTRPGLRGAWLALDRASMNVEDAAAAAALEAAAKAVRHFEAGCLDEAAARAALEAAAAALDQARAS